MVIKPYPPLSSDRYFRQLKIFKRDYLDKTSVVHNKGGVVFLKHMKLLMAKLGMNDFSDLSGQMAQTRVDVCFKFIHLSLLFAWVWIWALGLLCCL